MKCLFCNSETKVTNKRDIGGLTRRRRECLKCKKRFTTIEQPEFKELRVIKKSGVREGFNRDKIRNGLLKACEKRPVSIDIIEKVVGRIEAKLREGNKREVKSATIGEMIMKELKKMDKIAYIRFASVYKNFEDIADFKEAMKEVK